MDFSIQELAKAIAEQIACTSKEVLTTEEASRYLGVSMSSIYHFTSTHTIPHFKRGRMCYFNRRELDAWAQSNRACVLDEVSSEKNPMA